jgi:hypothetical protein
MRPAQARAVMGVAMLGLLGGATELARCPQVVGFSAAQSAGWQVTASVAPVRAASGFAYQPVVFRPDRVRGPQGPDPTHRDSAAMKRAPKMSAARKQSVGSNGLIHRGMDARGGEWVMVTSWSGIDGSHMVMTTLTVPSGAEGSVRAFKDGRIIANANPSNANETGASEADARSSQAAPQQLHRYAAVPVRGGWLVFQL